MALKGNAVNPIARRRQLREWSQAELARLAGIPRTTVSAIEGERLTPSVTAALALARTLECSVEELFCSGTSPNATDHGPEWAWQPRFQPCRYWEAEVSGRRVLYPVESLAMNVIPHDGVWRGGLSKDVGEIAGTTLVLACCDPAAGILAAEYARTCGFRLIVFPRSGGEAISLLKRGLVHAAGLHRSTKEQPGRNAETVREEFGDTVRLLRVADWQEGLALRVESRSRSPRSIAQKVRRWALRETGSAARECLEELRTGAPGKTVHTHTAVAEAVRGGWAEAGVCVQLAAEEAGLSFLPVRSEALDFCFHSAMQHDPRILALIRLLRSRSYRRLISELPGYDARNTGEVIAA